MTAIPGGTHTYSKLRFPGPVRRARWGNGCEVCCDPGPQLYVDTVAGLGCVSLGYQDGEVDAAIKDQLLDGISFSVPTALEEDVAQHLLRFLDWGERVRFSKNGADVTNLAVRLARAATGNDTILSIGYHGYSDWCQVAADSMIAGIPQELRSLVLRPEPFDRFCRIIDRPGTLNSRIAAVIIEPIPSQAHVIPQNGYGRHLRRLGEQCRLQGILLIYDCMITGMRLNRRGWPDDAPEPDLACYGKAMGNGMPLSALVGPAYLLDRITDDVFFSTTFGGECLSLAAADAVLTAYEERDVLTRMEETGNRLNAQLTGLAARHGLSDQLEIVSYPARPFHKWRTKEQAEVFTKAMLDEGILYMGYHNLMLATCEHDPIVRIERAHEVAMEAVVAL